MKMKLKWKPEFMRQHAKEILEAVDKLEGEVSVQERNAAAANFIFRLDETNSWKKLELSQAQLDVLNRWSNRQRAYYQKRHRRALNYFIDWARENYDGWEPVDWHKIVSMAGQLSHDVGTENAAKLFSELAKNFTGDVFGGGRGDRLTPVECLPLPYEPDPSGAEAVHRGRRRSETAQSK